MSAFHAVPTRKAFLEDSYLFSMDAKIQAYSFASTAAEGSSTAAGDRVDITSAARIDGFLVLDATCFYPQGGGQPTDEGTIRLNMNTVVACGSAAPDARGDSNALDYSFVVKKVTTNEHSQVVHYGHGSLAFWKALVASSSTAAAPAAAAPAAAAPAAAPAPAVLTVTGTCGISSAVYVHLHVDERLRRLYMKLHSTGHAIDAAMRNVGIKSERLLGTKGYHFLDGPYVEYQLQPNQAELTSSELSTLPQLLTVELRRLVELDILTTVEDMARETVRERCKDDVQGIDLSAYPDVVRVVRLCGVYIPCGGTHIRSSKEIGNEVVVTKLKKKKSTYKVSYTVSGM